MPLEDLKNKGYNEEQLTRIIDKYYKLKEIYEFCIFESKKLSFFDFGVNVDQEYNLFVNNLQPNIDYLKREPVTSTSLNQLEQFITSIPNSMGRIIPIYLYYNTQNIDKRKIRNDRKQVEDIKIQANSDLKEIENKKKEFELGFQAILQKEVLKGYENQFQLYVEENKKSASKWMTVLLVLIVFLAVFVLNQLFIFKFCWTLPVKLPLYATLNSLLGQG